MEREPNEKDKPSRRLPDSSLPATKQESRLAEERSPEPTSRSLDTHNLAAPKNSEFSLQEPSLPESYGETSLVIAAVDPCIIHCQWDVSPGDFQNAKQTLGVGHHDFWPVVRMHEVGSGTLNGGSLPGSFDVDVQLQARNWYVRSCAPDRTYRADLALRREDGSFVIIASSNQVHTPPAAPSTQTDESWAPIRLDPRPPIAAGAITPQPALAQPPNIVPQPALRLLPETEEVTKRSPAPQVDTRRKIRLRSDVPGSPKPMLAELRSETERDQTTPQREENQQQPQVQAARATDPKPEMRSAFVDFFPGYHPAPEFYAPDFPLRPTASPNPLHEGVLRQTKNQITVESSDSFDLTSLNERSFSPGTSSHPK